MKVEFKDYFSENSGEYSRFRPKYPVELFSYLASISNHHIKAWDCATGNGQAALYLSDYFSEVIATDASKTQIEHAIEKEGVAYQVAPAEKSNLESNSIDLITVAQALHWFNINAFSKEANRVLKDRGIIAVWAYNLLTVNDGIDQIINNMYESVLGEFWPKERKMVENGYRSVQLPFNEVESPEFRMTENWNLSQLMGYLCTWSAVRNYQKELGVNPVEEIHNKISKIWGGTEKVRPVNWPLSVRLWQKNTKKSMVEQTRFILTN